MKFYIEQNVEVQNHINLNEDINTDISQAAYGDIDLIGITEEELDQ